MPTRPARLIAAVERSFLQAVLAAGALGLAAPTAGRWLVRYDAIAILLFLLVLASALDIQRGIARRLTSLLPRLGAVLVCSTITGIAAAWLASHLVPDPALRHGVLALGVAPAEIATVAMTNLAGAEPAIAAALLVASTVVSVVIAGSVLGALAGSTVDTSGTILQLGLVVGAPLLLGLVLRPAVSRFSRATVGIPAASVVLVVALVYLVASQIHLSGAYLWVGAAIVAFITTTTVAAFVISRLVDSATRPAVVLGVAVRDFAVASGIAEAAFGPRSSGPLGLYGIAVIATGAGLVRLLRVHSPPDDEVRPAAT